MPVHCPASVLLLLFFVPGRRPREPRLNPTNRLPTLITVQISPTIRGGGKLHPSSLLIIGRHIEPTAKVATQKPIAHKMMNMILFIISPELFARETAVQDY
jgi:hypothetical protein